MCTACACLCTLHCVRITHELPRPLERRSRKPGPSAEVVVNHIGENKDAHIVRQKQMERQRRAAAGGRSTRGRGQSLTRRAKAAGRGGGRRRDATV